MMLSWRRRRGVNKKNDKLSDNLDMEISIPTHFRCPISLDLMKDPVTLSTGMTYDRESIEKWIESGNQTCPVTNQVISSFELIPNHSIRKMIQSWCVENRSLGVERIPTPRIPVSKYEVSKRCQKIFLAVEKGDARRCLELVEQVKHCGKESERNKRCLVENGGGIALAAALESFGKISMEKHLGLLEEILALLTWMVPIGPEAESKLVSPSSLRCIVWFLRCEDLGSRKNAILLLKELLASSSRNVETIAMMEGVLDQLVNIIRHPICPQATNASLKAIFSILSSQALDHANKVRITSKFFRMDLLSVLIDLLVDAEKAVSEKALGVIDLLCDCEEGKEMAYKNALVLPILVKKILRVSHLGTEFAVSILWKLCKSNSNDNGDDGRGGGIVIEALQVGAFQKLLVVLQVGCSENMKGKVIGLLKLINLYKGTLDCVDSSMGLRYLKRSY